MSPLAAHAGSIYTRRGPKQTMIDPISLEVVAPGDMVWQLPCAHAFLADGLRRWFGDAVWATCPCCRRLFCRGDAQLPSRAAVSYEMEEVSNGMQEEKGMEEKGMEENGMEEKGLEEESNGMEEKGMEEESNGMEEKGMEAKEEQLRSWQGEKEDFVSAFLRVARGLLPPCVLLAGCAERLLVLSRGDIFVVEAYDRQTEQVQVWGRVRRAQLWGARLHWKRLLLYLHNSPEARRPVLQDWLKMEYLWSEHRFPYRWEWLLCGSFVEAELLVPEELFSIPSCC